jgi:hypothetical protein
MTNKNKILIVSFLLIGAIISLFPPFSWDNERLRSPNDRDRLNYYFEDKIPVKGYDFLFNDLKKEFIFSDNKVVLERHLLLGELLIETFIALLISAFFQFLYNHSSPRIIFFSLYLLMIFLLSGISLLLINSISPWFQPDYSIILQTENKIKSDYPNLLTNNNVFELSIIVDKLKKGFRADWDDPTNEFWNSIYSSLILNSNNLPKIENFLEKTNETNIIRNKKPKPIDWSQIDKEVVFQHSSNYRNYLPPKGYKVNYSKLLDLIDLQKYNTLINILQNYPAFTLIKTKYRENLDNYWINTIPRIKIWSIVMIIFLISLLFFIKKKWVFAKIELYNLRFNFTT